LSRSGTIYEVEGAFVEVDKPEEITMVWQGQGEPGHTLLKWELEPNDDGTKVKLEHSGFGSGPRWKAAYAQVQRTAQRVGGKTDS